MRGLGLGFINPVGTGGCWTCDCVWAAVVWMAYVGVCWGLGIVSGRVGWCYVYVSCEYGLFVKMTGPSICILC